MKCKNTLVRFKKYLFVIVTCQLCWFCKPKLTTQAIDKKSESEINGVLNSFSNSHPSKRIFQKFQNPPEVNSENSIFSHNMEVSMSENDFYDYKNEKNIILQHRNYNNQIVGETWRIKPGDSLLIHLMNHLENNKNNQTIWCNSHECYTESIDSITGKVIQTIDKGHDHEGNINEINPLNFNNTNLHVHGLHVSPTGQSDNVFVNLDPGQDFYNKIKVPKDHAMGTFWYHGHVHGSTAIQVSSGMAGAIIIEGGLDEQPEIKNMKEKIFMLQQMPYTVENDTAKIKYITGKPEGQNTFGNGTWKPGKWRTTINGQVLPVLHMQENEVQRWRFIHGGIRESVNLKLVSIQQNRKLHLEKLYGIAEDGIAYGYRSNLDSILLHPGYRADLLIKAPKDVERDTLLLIDDISAHLGAIEELKPKLKSTGINNDDETLKVLAVVVVDNTKKSIETELPTSEDLTSYAPYPSLVDKTPVKKVEDVLFNIRLKDSITKIGDTIKAPIFMVSGKPYNPHNIPRQLILNQIQDWQLSSNLGNHPYHIHVNHFQIIAKQYRTESEENPTGWTDWGELIPEKQPKWKDTYMVNDSERTIIRTVYKDFTGKFVLHCHILMHEDEGMMQEVEILDSKQFSEITNPRTGLPLKLCK